MKPAGPAPDIPMTVLVEQAQHGDARAFEQLVERFRLRVYCVAMRYVGDYDEASDVCQEALCRAWERLSTLQEPSRFSAWLEQIVIHLSLDARRRRSTRQAHNVSLEERFPSGESEDPQLSKMLGEPERSREYVLEKEITVHLLRAIEALPETLREAAMMRFIEGLPAEAIAQRLGIEYEAARKRVYRASLDLRQRLQALYQELLGAGAP